MPRVLVDVGNTSVTWCMEYDDDPGQYTQPESLSTQRLLAGTALLPDSWHFSNLIVASVVPKIDELLRRHKDADLYFVSHQDFPEITLRVDHPEEVGVDRIVNVYAAERVLKRRPLVVVDFGTATTFDVLDADGGYLGGVIAPGLALSRDILSERTAKLPLIELFRPQRMIGRNTVNAMASGLILATEAMVNGVVREIEGELKQAVGLVLTGGYVDLIQVSHEHKIVKQLCFEGLKQIGG